MSDEKITRVAVSGAAGRMGRRLCALAAQDPALNLVEAFERPGHEALGQPAAAGVEIPIGDAFAGRADVLIDFTSPTATRALLDACVDQNVAMVIGTTGLSAEDLAAIDQAARSIPIVQAANFSLVVNVLDLLAAKAAVLLGEDYDIEILEAHHRYKKDAPSGTALQLGRSICQATGRSFQRDVVCTRHGDDVVRQRGQITIQALRMGDVIGEHTVFLAAPGERMELRHVGSSRDSYVTGALRAAAWLHGRSAGRYGMADVLGLAG
jgi:4-hydroxy-tetrahydrodipicolinate reductase